MCGADSASLQAAKSVCLVGAERYHPGLNKPSALEVEKVSPGRKLDHFKGESEQADFPAFVYSMNYRTCAPFHVGNLRGHAVDYGLKRIMNQALGQVALADLKTISQERRVSGLKQLRKSVRLLAKALQQKL
jgi:hypothetical protein